MPLRDFTAKIFLGRSREIETLKSLASQAASGDAQSIVLLGKRGFGKTELLKHLYSEMFNGAGDAVPFLYTVKASFASVENFSKDYLSSFILQCLAFIKKDPTLLNAGNYSLEDLRDIADRSDASWAADLISNFNHIQEMKDPIKLFSFVISCPYQSYRHTGRPVVVMIDDFHKIRKISEFSAGEHDQNLWMCFENYLQFRYAPHIIAGFQADLHKMFFEETSFGEHLEVIDLSRFGRQDAFRLFTNLCSQYGVAFNDELKNYIDLFSGNPFYIKSFIQTARHAIRSLTEENFWDLYLQEITKGKIYTHWTSVLKAYVPLFQHRKPVLNVLYHLAVYNGADVYEKLPDLLSLQREKLDSIINKLHSAGTVDMGFSTIEFTDDKMLADIVRGLYYREILRETSEKTREIITEGRKAGTKLPQPAAFEFKIPADQRAESAAVQSFEHIADYFQLSPDTIGKLQVSLADLFAGVLADGGISEDSYGLKFFLKDRTFILEIITSRQGLALTDDHSRRIRAHVDDIKIEEIMQGAKIILFKKLKDTFAPAS